AADQRHGPRGFADGDEDPYWVGDRLEHADDRGGNGGDVVDAFQEEDVGGGDLDDAEVDEDRQRGRARDGGRGDEGEEGGGGEDVAPGDERQAALVVGAADQEDDRGEEDAGD